MKKGYNNTVDRSSSFKGFMFIFTIISCIFTAGAFTRAIGKDALEVTRDKDKTTYAIDPSGKNSEGKTEEEKERERALDMLKHMNIIIDKQGKSGHKDGK